MNGPTNTEDPPLPPRFKFGLREPFYATTLIAAGLAIDPTTIALSLLVLLIWWACFTSTDPKAAFFIMMLPLLVMVPLIFMFSITTSIGPNGSYRQNGCINNMRQITLAMQSYESINGHFPTDRIVILDDGTELSIAGESGFYLTLNIGRCMTSTTSTNRGTVPIIRN